MIGALLMPARRQGYFLMAHLFLDDSGKESQAAMPIVVLAGYLAQNDVLESLDQRWLQLLIKHGIREIHMKQLVPMSGIYKNLGWDDNHRDAVVGDFIQVINETRMIGVGIAVKTSSWKTYKIRYPEIKWRSIQQFLLERALSRVVSQLHDAGVDEHLHLTFDTDP